MNMICLAASLMLVTLSGLDTPCTSGPTHGQRTGPYAAIISTGPERGRSHCYICETGEKPAVIVFARSLSKELGPLAEKVDKAMAEHKAADLRGWMTFLKGDQLKFDPQVVNFAKEHSLGRIPIGIFEDEGGPPSYRLTRDADITVLVCKKQKVEVNFAFRSGELTPARLNDIVKAINDAVKTAK
ncbi:hypothetical protein BH10PLA2_BH10PLA2_39300 [soil metagenome]